MFDDGAGAVAGALTFSVAPELGEELPAALAAERRVSSIMQHTTNTPTPPRSDHASLTVRTWRRTLAFIKSIKQIGPYRGWRRVGSSAHNCKARVGNLATYHKHPNTSPLFPFLVCGGAGGGAGALPFTVAPALLGPLCAELAAALAAEMRVSVSMQHTTNTLPPHRYLSPPSPSPLSS